MDRDEKIITEMIHNLMAAADAADVPRAVSARYLLTAGIGATIGLSGPDAALAQANALVRAIEKAKR